MTRFNPFNVHMSIKSKLWLAIVGTVVAVIGVLWLLQVVFVEDYYLNSKEKEFSEVVSQVTQTLTEKGLVNSRDTLYSLAGQYVLCIDVCDSSGNTKETYEGLNYNCYIHKNELRRLDVVGYAVLYGAKAPVITVKGANNVSEYFIAPRAGYSEVDGSFIVTVSVALAPIREASLAIRQQFLMFSIILVLASMGIAFWISHGLTKNILKISNAAKQVAHGNLNVDVSVSSNDELGELASSFTEMTKEISKVNILQKELVANISHDIRTPLTMIRGYAEAIKDITGDDKETRERQLDIIISESNRLGVLTNDILDLSLMQAGQSLMKQAPFDIAKKAADVLSRFELLEQTSDFSFVLNSQKSVIAYGDEVRIEQVLYNLISNAVNHIGQEKMITVSIEEMEKEVLISVTDTGTGIASEDLPLIWDRYYKPYKKTERKSVGTGLGLSIVKAVLINHNSRFGVDSTLGVGSRFWFTLKYPEQVISPSVNTKKV